MPGETDAIDTLAARLFPAGGDAPMALGLTAAKAGAGVTHVAVKLAQATSGRFGKNTLLIDLNFYAPKLASIFPIAKKPGVAEVLAGTATPNAALWQVGERLNVMSAGAGALAPAALLGAAGFSFLQQRLLQHFDIVLFDCPALEDNRETGALARAIGTMVLVVAAERTRKTDARGAIEALEKAGARLAGIVLNRQRRYVPAWLDRRL